MAFGILCLALVVGLIAGFTFVIVPVSAGLQLATGK